MKEQQPKRILIINQPVNNRGDESAHRALVRMLARQYPQHRIEVLFTLELKDSIKQFKVDAPNVSYVSFMDDIKNPNLIQKIYRSIVVYRLFNEYLIYAMKHGKTWMLRLNPITNRIWCKIRRADIILNAPGGICMGGFQNWRHIAFLEMARQSGKDTFYYGRSFGPFPTKNKGGIVFKDYSKKLLENFKFLAIRDNKTEQLAREMGLKYTMTVDTPFLETPRADLPKEMSEQIGDNYMVFVPNVLRWHYAFKDIPAKRIHRMFEGMMEVIAHQDEQMKLVMLPQTFNYANPLQNDVNFFRELRDNSPYRERIVVMDDIYSSDIQQTIISKARFLVGARYHSAVFAINNDIPFVALSYEHKIVGLLTTLQATDCMIDITDLSTEEKADEYIGILESRLNNMSPRPELTQQAKEIAKNCFDKFTHMIDGYE